METYSQIYSHMPEKNLAAAQALTSCRGTTEFFVGWMKRLGNTMILFEFPTNKKEHPDL